MKRIVIIDDSLTVRMDLGEAFKEAGYSPTLCATLDEARKYISGTFPDLVILDVLLPDGDGVDLLRELRHDQSTAEVPILMLSTESEVKDRIRGLKTGANEYVGKPYDTSYVIARSLALLKKPVLEIDTRHTVLIIDDSATFREELGARLRDVGYIVISAGSGEEGLKRAVANPPDSIIVDGVMPGMDGTTVVRRIRFDPGLQSTPCILLTASDESSSEVLALDSGADAFVRKDEGIDVIKARLGAVLRSASESRGQLHESSLFGPKRVLAVDDSRTFLEELSDQLQEEGFEVVKALSGQEALDLLSVDKVDCILLDLLMPRMSGTETCGRIKGSTVTRNIPLIMLTALEDSSAMIEGINAGADDYILKSSDFEVLKARLRAQLRRKQFEDENRRVREKFLQKDTETRAARELAETRSQLLHQLELKNRELVILNQELKQFAYSVSHDLGQPIRSMSMFSRILLDEYSEHLDKNGKHYLDRIEEGAKRMGEMIEGLLTLSRLTRREMSFESLDIADLAKTIIQRLREGDPQRTVNVDTKDNLKTYADPALLTTVLENLLGNAWKFTSQREDARIEVGKVEEKGESVFYVRDNGAGFDMKYVDKLFGLFQRLHSETEFPGTGIGLATVQRIVHRHGGRIRAEGRPNEGATFFFSLGSDKEITKAVPSQ
ncbi:MAG: response regulator [bacterium]